MIVPIKLFTLSLSLLLCSRATPMTPDPCSPRSMKKANSAKPLFPSHWPIPFSHMVAHLTIFDAGF